MATPHTFMMDVDSPDIARAIRQLAEGRIYELIQKREGVADEELLFIIRQRIMEQQGVAAVCDVYLRRESSPILAVVV